MRSERPTPSDSVTIPGPAPANRAPRRRASRRAARLIAALATACLWIPAQTAADTAAICDAAAARAAAATGVPLEVLLAITRTETGRGQDGTVRPWPWTVNMEGKGRWFDTRAEAYAYAHRHYNRGARSFDMGCFQINYRWHHEGFDSIEQMLDPDANARYAAGFLARLHRQTGSWSEAAGAYHSRTPKYAKRYRRRFDRLLAALDGAPSAPPAATRTAAVAAPPTDAGARPHAETPVTRANTFPLLLAAGGTGQLGSLVPLDGPQARALLAPEPPPQ